MRLIDADKLMTELMDSDLDHLQRDDWKEVVQIVQEAPTAPQWIPCSEHTPTEDGEYITTVETCEGMFVTSHDWRQDWKEWGFLSYYGESGTPAWRRVTNVVAWMPLPKPYGGN